ncbi:aldehyde dehydrogenase [Mycolicibacterium thermoresistibile]|uniref:NAD-dependent aldehyde dehydrogenase n=2 Tax=Mycolicibacterium thermoresistibile TaxID=1797 RepID=G7CJA9_MYCT3|nr:aldehyde dehydrogenase [Mycolicibacterium thermoresistibile]EHI12707.1 NAD-dependent aldehyde dehydrogenase [Mycolicibacterium thermoresistibile ATCC 19527]MCV7190032.1 aldehyde dehydrogenase [Mycolicibacterium thermoresistibile]GAT13911.1 NAD-dependent aldehyde dehydrogenase [Mycolicibacterium thermoresistibile]SNW19084.1 NAD-dependent aldehyde dehydrogenase [Mycolicibacterium thermoresistibile]
MLARTYSSFFIDGDWREPASTETFTVISPASGEPIGSVPSASTADIDVAVEAARRAFYETDWPRRPVEERAALCEALAAKIHEHRADFIDLVVDELGCTRQLAEVYQAVAPTLHWNYNAEVARNYPLSEVRTADLGPLAGGSEGGMIMPYQTQSLVVREPVGVVATLVAYNFAFAGTAQKVAPAVAAGCTVVIKVPEPNPLAIFAMGELIREVGFPPGVINIVAAGPAASEHLVSHPDVDMVSFTGSTTVGSKIGRVCGERIRPAVLELGGKSAAIVLDDADLETTIPTLLGVSVIPSSGQSCVCQSRFLVPRSRHDEIVDRLVEALRGVKVGDPHDPDTQMGPLITEAHRRRVLGFIDRAVEQGAKVAFGGGIPEGLDRGWYVEPTLLTNVHTDMEIAREEVFGPVVAVIPYDDEDDAVRIANDSRYGLAGSVFTSDIERGFEIARRVRTGTFSVNSFSADFNSPFGGFKDSGIGREHGVAGFEEYLVPKTISVDPSIRIPESVVAKADRVVDGAGR